MKNLWLVRIFGYDMDTTAMVVVAENENEAADKATEEYGDGYYTVNAEKLHTVNGYKITLEKEE